MQNNYGSDEKISTKLEHVLPPIFTYLVRKLNLAVVVALLWTARQLSKPYGFNYSASVSDRDSWKWFSDVSVPVPHARLKRISLKRGKNKEEEARF